GAPLKQPLQLIALPARIVDIEARRDLERTDPADQFQTPDKGVHDLVVGVINQRPKPRKVDSRVDLSHRAVHYCERDLRFRTTDSYREAPCSPRNSSNHRFR